MTPSPNLHIGRRTNPIQFLSNLSKTIRSQKTADKKEIHKNSQNQQSKNSDLMREIR